MVTVGMRDQPGRHPASHRLNRLHQMICILIKPAVYDNDLPVICLKQKRHILAGSLRSQHCKRCSSQIRLLLRVCSRADSRLSRLLPLLNGLDQQSVFISPALPGRHCQKHHKCRHKRGHQPFSSIFQSFFQVFFHLPSFLIPIFCPFMRFI